MVSDEFLYEIFDFSIVVGDDATVLGGKYDVFDSFYFCRRAGQTDLCRVGIDVCCAPFLKIKITFQTDTSL